MILADKITELRKKNGWSQEELADKLGVSRQAVSKWESAQSTPDLGRLLAMADLFSVSTDYLLRDELDSAIPETPTADEAVSDSPVRRVSLEEANAYLALQEGQAPMRALAVSLCVFSPIPLLLILSRTGEGAFAATGSVIGIVVLLVMVAIAVSVFIRQNMAAESFKFLSTENIETAYGVSGMVKERKAAHRETYTRGLVVGVLLCILSAVPVLLGALAADSTPAAEEQILLPCVALLLAMVGIAVYLFVRVGSLQSACDQLLETGDYTRENKKISRSPLIPGYWCLTTAIYLLWSFLSQQWEQTWIVWPVAGVLFAVVYGLIGAAHQKR